ncbi:MAG: DUF4198 domain-containing protein [Sulfuricaulis sp.]|uniref:DUF4198 domain-containing protein n=1 Tax=Sulfuricaulis sp. TaxID=2003553 RepID=UPI0025DED7E6|nr:DUF4198 domain-containing protein [Sulfuricaulis sp.]MCR4347665.1 DUF4198 domain-containing protein [Sulfuricaulis sp.]
MTIKFRAQFIRNSHRLLVAAFLAIAVPTEAHDFWIEPQVFQPKPGSAVPIRLLVGQDFKGDSVPYFPQKFERYIIAGPAGTRPIPGVLGDEPAGTVTPAAPGLYIIGLHTKPDSVSFDTLEEFEKYLRKEGLERNLALQQQRQKSGKKIEETYFRCAKSLIAASTPPDTAADQVLGFPLEFIAETNPYRTPKLRLRLLYQNKPLEGALVVAFNKAEPLAKLKGRTDDNGRVEFILPRSGVWLVTSVHMIPASFFSSYDWESLWASLTFERP